MQKICAKAIAMLIAVCLLCGTIQVDVLARSSVSGGDVNSVELVRNADVNEEDWDDFEGNDEIPATSIELNEASLSLAKGKTFTLEPAISPTNTTDEVKWSSSNTKVAKVSDKGEVTAVSKGTATITATTTSGITATCKVTVTVPSTKIKLNKTSVSINKGKTYTLKGELTPGSSTDTITWRSSNTKVAKVSDKGVVKAVSKGTATITATTTSGKKATCKVTVKVPATKVKLNKTSVTIYEGKTYTLKGTLTPSNSTDTIKWTSSNTKVAKVSGKGVVTAVSKGTATITAKATGGKQKKCKVTVKKPSVNAKTKKLVVNEAFTLKLTGAKAVSFTSGDSSVATVTNKGKIKAKKAGKTTITITDEKGNQYTCKVTVKNDPYSSEQVYATMIALQKDYPEGKSWTNDNFYITAPFIGTEK